MNRIQSTTAYTDASTGPAAPHVDSALFARARSSAPSSLFIPLHYEPKYAYPLLVWLHGPDDDENQLKKIMPLVSMRNYVAVAPRGRTASRGETADTRTAWTQQSHHIAAAEQRVEMAIELAKRRVNVASHRVFLAGFSCGGTMALRLAMKHPDRFAGVLSLCGAFPRGMAPLSRLDEARRVPVFVAAGRQSAQYPESRVCEDLRLLHSAGMVVAVRVYPCGQSIAPDMLTDMDRWMMEIVTGGAVAAED